MEKGSRISLDYGDEQGKPHTISIKVVGVLDEGAQILGHDFGQGNRLYYDYRDIFLPIGMSRNKRYCF